MENFEVTGGLRETGKSAVRKLKDEGLIPAIIYGEGGGTPVSLNADEVSYLLNKHGDNVTLTVNVGGRPVKTRIIEVQREPLYRNILHIDLMPIPDVLH